MESDQVIAMATAQLRKKPVSEQTILETAIFLSDKAREKWLEEDLYVDDITVIVLIIQQMTKPADAKDKKPADKSDAKTADKAGKRIAVLGSRINDDDVLKKVAKPKESADLIWKAVKDPRHLIFEGMSDTTAKTISECMYEQKCKQGEEIIKQGDVGDELYIVESGKYDVYLEQSGPSESVHTYSKGDSFGELALMYSSARAATVRCTGAGKLWVLDRQVYKRLAKEAIDAHEEMVMKEIKTVASLKDLDDYQLHALLHSAQMEIVESGHTLMRNTKVDSLYILQSGQLEVCEKDGKPARLQAGQWFGEEALAAESGMPTALTTVTAMSDCTLVRVTHEAFERHVGALMEIKREQFNIKAMNGLDELKRLSLTEKRHIAKAMTRVVYTKGTVIAKKGADLETLTIIHKGKVEAMGGKKEHMDEGDGFGDDAIFKRTQALGDIIAVDEVTAFVATRENVQKQLGPLNALIDRKNEGAQKLSAAKSIELTALHTKKILGVGTFGVVKLVVDPKTNAIYALKQMRKDKIIEMGQLEHLYDECRLLSECDHPFIVRLVKLFEDKHRIYLLQDSIMGGELFSVLRNEKCFPERRVVFYSAMLVLIFEYLHDHKIIYRDLKPENLLFDKDGYLKMVDFGFAKKLDQSGFTHTVCGTPEYMAPEIILNQGHNKAVDWWTVGIIIYEMLVGFPPFEGDDPLQLYKAIVANEPKYPKKIGPQAVDIIKQLLMTKPADRLASGKNGAEDVKKHAFYKKIIAWHSLVTKKIEAPYKPSLKNELDCSNFDEFDDPDLDNPPKDVKQDLFKAYTDLIADFNQ